MGKSKHRYQIVILSLMMFIAWILPLFAFQNTGLNAYAISADYPVPLMNIATKDNSKVLTENGTADNATVSVKALGNDLSPSWRFDRVGSDSKGTYFKLVNAQSGRMLTPSGYNVQAGTDVIMYGAESAQSQHWYVVPVTNDHYGNGLYYKIVNYSDTSLALTQGSNGMTLASYTGADNQLWLINADGLQGFAGYCFDDTTGSPKASDIGGLFGEVVEAGDFDTLKKYAESDTPYTIVVTNNISVTELTLNGERYICTAGRIYLRNNKTIVGSYGNHTLYNVQFCTNSRFGVGDNIIIKNFESTHDAESNNNDSIQFYFGSGKNIWVDHVTFVGHDNYGYAPKTQKVDEDKFLACCYDADYCTVSDCSFGAHKYGLILGYPSDDENSKANYDGYPRMTLAGNKFNDTNTRGPGLMRWGYYHSLNNYVNKFSMAYTVISNCDIYAENCVYENGGNVICDWGDWLYSGHYSETGSVFSGCNRTVQGGDSNSTATATSWRPKNNYSYVSLTAANAKTYCSTYSGCQSAGGNMMYLRFGTKGVPSAGFNTAPSTDITPSVSTTPVAETFANGATFKIKNANSELYMQVESAKAENGANVQQWGTSDDITYDIWKLVSAGDGYYYIVSAVGDGGTYVLDIAGKKTDNGTNVDIYQSNSGINQQFMFTKNSDGSYKILTKVSGGKSAVEVENADKSSGANIQQWEINDETCQNWILESVSNPGCTMDTSFVYEFKNVNSGMVMDIANGTMEADTNVQQWESNGFDCQRWILQDFAGGGNYYYIRSVSNPTYVLRADGSGNGGNVAIAEYSTKDSAMLFKFVKNLDGSYSIMTRASKDACFVEVESASNESGANVQQWENTESDCQKWSAETFTTTKATTTTTSTTTTTTTTVPTTTATTATKAPETAAPTTVPTTVATEVPTTTVEVVGTILWGDANCDGMVNMSDAAAIIQHIGNKSSYALSNQGIINADIVNNGDGIFTSDAILIQKMLAGEIEQSAFPITSEQFNAL